GILRGVELGVPQRRERCFLVASRSVRPNLAQWLKPFRVPARSVRWAIEDLVERAVGTTFDTPSTASGENRRRMHFLHSRDLLDLPDAERPPCHRGGGHSYWAIYGRLPWDGPAQTITTGFGCTGQGRY